MSKDIQIIPKAIADSVVNTFKVQFQTPSEIVSVVTEPPSPLGNKSLMATLGLKSSDFGGSLALWFPETTFLPIVNHMMGENDTCITKDNADAAGEILNIIYTTAKTKINETGFDFQPSIPTVVIGTNLQLGQGSATKIMKLNCKCSHGEFYVIILLSKK